MRFLRVGAAGNETPVALIPATDRAYDLTSLTDDIDDEFLRTWHEHADAIRSGILPTIDIRDMRIGAPIARPSAVYAIGLNYANHADETKMELPGEPIVFSKAPNSICGPTDDVTLPPGSTKGDWEVELGVVIGKPTYRLAAVTDAADAIAGFVAANDVSERAWQLERGGQWLKGKSFPTANPIGPYLVTPDEIGDINNLTLKLSVNGVVRQNGSTANMIFPPDYLVWYLSQFVQLEAGDLINTGTPDGVGLGMNPPVFLVDGDVMELSITGLGQQRSRVHIPVAP